MAVHFADTIVWSPDSSAVAFVAMIRGNQPSAAPAPSPTSDNQASTNSEINANANANANANTDANVNANVENTNAANADANVENTNAANADANIAAPQQTPVAEAPKPVLTFRTEQIYICTREGADLKPVTQNEGLLYFYFVWSPDSSALAALAAVEQEWNYLKYQAELKGEQFAPQGRPRLVEKNGRERRLDDNLTTVRPVWSPDSAKVAAAFDKQVRIYDAIGNQPTQAAIPLRNQLLISSKAFDETCSANSKAQTATRQT
jgi:hypothetical protein